MVSATVERGPIAASERERPVLSEIDHLLNARYEQSPKLVGPNGEQIELPESVFRVLRQVIHALAQDQAVSVVPVHKLLTTQQAAEVLGMSRPYLVRLLDAGEIPFTKTGTHRRIRFDDLMTYASLRDAHRRKGLSRLTRMSQEMGLYSEG